MKVQITNNWEVTRNTMRITFPIIVLMLIGIFMPWWLILGTLVVLGVLGAFLAVIYLSMVIIYTVIWLYGKPSEEYVWWTYIKMKVFG